MLKGDSVIISFVQALLRKPQLAQVVRVLFLSRHWYLSEEKPQCDPELFREIVEKASHSTEERVKWETGLLNGLEDALVELLLVLPLDNLRRLLLEFPGAYSNFPRAFQRAANREKPFDAKPGFPRLEKVEIEQWDDDDYIHPSTVLPFFRFPSMRALIASGVVETSFEIDKHLSQLPLPGSSSITYLNLWYSNGCYGMRDLISSCANLECFKYNHADTHMLGQRFRPSVFFDSLAPAKKSLRSLWLDYCWYHIAEDIEDPDTPHNDRFGSLADFPKLREVRIRLRNLLDIRPGPGGDAVVTTPLIDILSSSIEWLYIEDCKEKYAPILVSQLQDLVSHRRTRVPRLARLDIQGQFFVRDHTCRSSMEGIPMW